SDLLWKKLETRVRKIADRFDGVMGVTILDLTDGRSICVTLTAFFRLRAQSRLGSFWSYIVRTRRPVRAPNGERSWTTHIPSIRKLWWKTAESWRVSPRA